MLDPSIPLKQQARATPGLARDIATILILGLAPAAGLGLGRFAYALVLPDMRASLDWNYVQAGSMNTANAVGYLAAVLVTPALIARISAYRVVVLGALVCVAGLALSAVTGNFAVLCIARLLTGIAGSLTFVGGGVLAAQISQRHGPRATVLLFLFYSGPGFGILLPGLFTPALLESAGPGSWRLAWAMLAVLAVALTLPLAFAKANPGRPADAPSAAPFRIWPIAAITTGYLVQGAGYVAYMTFMIAWVRDQGGGPGMQSAFWSTIGVGAIVSTGLWGRAIASLRHGYAVAVMSASLFVAAAIPLLSDATPLLFVSAFMFGGSMFAVVAGMTAFVRKNYPQDAWAKVIAAVTMAFGIGQIAGPLISGAITDATSSLAAGLKASAALLAVAVLLAALQRDLMSAPRR